MLKTLFKWKTNRASDRFSLPKASIAPTYTTLCGADVCCTRVTTVYRRKNSVLTISVCCRSAISLPLGWIRLYGTWIAAVASNVSASSRYTFTRWLHRERNRQENTRERGECKANKGARGYVHKGEQHFAQLPSSCVSPNFDGGSFVRAYHTGCQQFRLVEAAASGTETK